MALGKVRVEQLSTVEVNRKCCDAIRIIMGLFRSNKRRKDWIGPLAGWELVRLARRGQSHRGRLLVAYLLLIAFIITPVLWFPNTDPTDLFTGPAQILSRIEIAEFGQRFALVLMEAALFAVVAMTPGYAATAIADEKERQTLPLLLTTALSDREIVFGKAAARLVFVLAAGAAGLPIISVVLFIGGVDGRFILAAVGLIAGTAALATAIGIHAGCSTPDLRSALIRAYAVSFVIICAAFIPPCVLISPFGVLGWMGTSADDPAHFLIGGIAYPVLQLLIATGLIANSVFRLRRELPAVRRTAVPSVPKLLDRDSESDGWDEEPDVALHPLARTTRTSSLPPIADSNPLLWKERYVSSRSKVGESTDNSALLANVGLGGLGLLLIVIGGAIIIDRLTTIRPEPDEGGRLMMTGGTVVLALCLIPSAVRLASAIARERRRQTLDPILALPVDRREILRTKVQAAIERSWWWLPVGLLAAGLSFWADGGWVFGIVAAAFVVAGAILTVGLGAFLTVRCPSEVKAIRFLVPAVVIVVGAPVGMWNATDWDNPLFSVLGFAAGAIVFACAGLLLWQRARRGIERLG